MSVIDHVLLTRFNLPSAGVESLIRAREGWLRDRIALFERYTVPSVAAQTNSAVRWIVYLDPESPDWLLERIRPHADSGLLRPILRATVSREELLADLRDTLGTPGEILLTSNLDNDDGLAVDYSERLVSVATTLPRAALYLTHGIVQGGGAAYLNTDRRNAFVAVRESWASPMTVWSEYHTALGQHMPVVEVGGPPGWLQVVHGANVSNRIRGRVVAPSSYRELFAVDLDATAPSRGAMLTDRLLGHPARRLRDGTRGTLRTQGLRLLGKERYDRLKYALARTARRTA
ncbi:glycosyltransferase [Nocardioides sp.]|uniref:glycosyltransferase n=1 Tax=Nocardioides sp. TaxID=35761 RepID=UPI0039E6AF89